MTALLRSLGILAFIFFHISCGGGGGSNSDVGNSAPAANSVVITDQNGGDVVVGDLLTCLYHYSDVDGDIEGLSSFQWLRNGTAITGASGSTYTPVAADSGQTITFEITPVAATGATPGTAAISSGLTVANSAPAAGSVTITDVNGGNAEVGDLLSGSYLYSDSDGDPEGASTFRWLRNGTVIVGATTADYTLAPQDSGKTIVFEVVPAAQSGVLHGDAVPSSIMEVFRDELQIELLQPNDDAYNVAVSYRVTGSGGANPVRVTRLTYEDLNSGDFGDITITSGQAIGPVTAAIGGTTSTTVWDSLADLGLGNHHLVTVTVEVDNGTKQASATSRPFSVSNGPLGDQRVYDFGIHGRGMAVGDVTGDGAPDIVVSAGSEIITAENVLGEFWFDRSDPLSDLTTVPFDPLPADVPPIIPGPQPNEFLTATPAPSEAVLLDTDSDGLLDLVVADSQHAPSGDVPLLSNVARVLTDASVDEFLLGPGIYADVTAHQTILTAVQGPAGAGLDVAGGVYESVQASFNNIAGHVPLTGPTSFPPPGASGDQGQDLYGWFVQDMLAVDLSPSGAPGNGREDLVVLHGVRQLRSALSGDARGVVVIRQSNPMAGGSLGTAFYLDPTDMGVLPTHIAVGDITSDAHANPGNPLYPLVMPEGWSDIVVANTGDSSLTFYIQVSPSPAPGVLPQTYSSIRLPMSTVLDPAPPAGDTVGVAIANLNGDGKTSGYHYQIYTPFLDLVVVGQASKTVAVLVYDPDPAAPGSIITATSGIVPLRVDTILDLPEEGAGPPALADLTGDGLPEIIVPMPLMNTLLVYENLGPVPSPPSSTPGVSFNPEPLYYATQFSPTQIVISDVNGDGRDDVVVLNRDSADASVFLQMSPGRLDDVVVVPAQGLAPTLLASGDVDGDGVSEVVAAMRGDNAISVFRRDTQSLLDNFMEFDVGTPDQQPAEVQSASLPAFPMVSDVTGDGRNDIALTVERVTTTVTPVVGGWEVITGDPLPATVSSLHPAASIDHAVGIGSGDLLYGGGTPDGIADIVLSGGSTGLELFPGTGAGAFDVPEIRSGFGTAAQTAILDVDGDGHLDLVVGNADEADRNFHIFYNGGAPPSDPHNPVIGSPAGFIGYGRLPSTPTMVDVSAAALPGMGVSSRHIEAGNFSGPGPADVITGTAQAGPTNRLTDATADFVDDGVLTGMYVRKTSGVGSGETPPLRARIVAVTTGTLTLATDLGLSGSAFITGDGYAIDPMPDIAFADSVQNAVGVAFQTAPRTFTAVTLVSGHGPGQIAAGDFNGDGLRDLAVPWAQDDMLAVYLQNPDPTGLGDILKGPLTLSAPPNPTGCTALDVDGDGSDDVVVSSPTADVLGVFLQR